MRCAITTTMYIFKGPVTLLFILALFSLLSTTSQQYSTCSETFTKLKEQKQIKHCKKLPTLAAELGWNFTEDAHNKTAPTRIDILFGTRLHAEMGWLAWGVNPTIRPNMVGTRAILGIRLENGSLAIATYNVTRNTKLGCGLQPSKIDVSVENMTIEYNDNNGYFTISATLYLPQSEYNISRLNHVWQVGYYTIDMEPLMHPTSLQNVDSGETTNLRTEESHSVGQHRHHLRVVHGILNIVGWGTLLPIGVLQARYLRVHPKPTEWWFVLHVSCQTIGYTLGTIGWIIGLWLGHVSRYYTFHKHRTLSIFIFTFASLQMLALRLKPKRKDEYRKFWNLYHHFLGYALLAAISINIFFGIGIFKPAHRIWKWFYIGILCNLGVIVLAFEICSWSKFLDAKKKKGEPKQNQDKTSQDQ